MKNYIAVVVLTGLVIVQGSPSFEEVLEHNELDNEGINVRAVSKDSVQLIDDSINLKRKDNVDAIGTIAISDKLKRSNLWEDLITPVIGSTDLMNGLKDLGKVVVNSEFKFPHPVDAAGKIADIIVTIAKLPWDTPQDLIKIIPKMVSVEKDLKGRVQCEDFICNIGLLGLEITVGYDAADSRLYLTIDFLGSGVLHEKIPITGLLYCELVQLPKQLVRFCIHANNVQLSDKRACVDLSFSFLGYSHTFPDICLYGSKKRN